VETLVKEVERQDQVINDLSKVIEDLNTKSVEESAKKAITINDDLLTEYVLQDILAGNVLLEEDSWKEIELKINEAMKLNDNNKLIKERLDEHTKFWDATLRDQRILLQQIQHEAGTENVILDVTQLITSSIQKLSATSQI
jgi:hypothetical protein